MRVSILIGKYHKRATEKVLTNTENLADPKNNWKIVALWRTKENKHEADSEKTAGCLMK